MADEFTDIEFRGERAKARIEAKDERGLHWERRNTDRVTLEQDLLQHDERQLGVPVLLSNEFTGRRRLFRRIL